MIKKILICSFLTFPSVAIELQELEFEVIHLGIEQAITQSCGNSILNKDFDVKEMKFGVIKNYFERYDIVKALQALNMEKANEYVNNYNNLKDAFYQKDRNDTFEKAKESFVEPFKIKFFIDKD